jgi:hypothetical protein
MSAHRLRALALLATLSSLATLPAVAADRAAFAGSFSVVLKTPAERALTLFDPVGEAEWAPGWAPVFARESDRAALPDGTVFTTREPGAAATTWLLQRYDRRAGEIAYAAFHPDDAVVATITIAVRPLAAGTAEAQVRYRLVATSTSGDRSVQEFESSFPHLQQHWQRALDAAIARRP